MKRDNRDNDPDETEGRRLYRDRADKWTRYRISYARRRVTLAASIEPQVPDEEEK